MILFNYDITKGFKTNNQKQLKAVLGNSKTLNDSAVYIIGTFNIVQFEPGKVYSVQLATGEKRLLKCTHSRPRLEFIPFDAEYGIGTAEIAIVYWEKAEGEVYTT